MEYIAPINCICASDFRARGHLPLSLSWRPTRRWYYTILLLFLFSFHHFNARWINISFLLQLSFSRQAKRWELGNYTWELRAHTAYMLALMNWNASVATCKYVRIINALKRVYKMERKTTWLLSITVFGLLSLVNDSAYKRTWYNANRREIYMSFHVYTRNWYNFAIALCEIVW